MTPFVIHSLSDISSAVHAVGTRMRVLRSRLACQGSHALAVTAGQVGPATVQGAVTMAQCLSSLACPGT